MPFMAPEQLRLERAVQRTDIFAAGVMLFALLTRELPYYDNSLDAALTGEELRKAMIERAEGTDWPRWSRVQGSLAQDTAAILSRLLEPEA
jgi:serine/threonine protein kinase